MNNLEIYTPIQDDPRPLSEQAREFTELRKDLMLKELLVSGVGEDYAQAHVEDWGSLEKRTEDYVGYLDEWQDSTKYFFRSVRGGGPTGQLLGICMGELRSDPLEYPEGSKYLATLLLAEAARGKGIGRELVTRFRGINSGDTYLHVFTGNDDARAFYDALGFVSTGEIVTNYIGAKGIGFRALQAYELKATEGATL